MKKKNQKKKATRTIREDNNGFNSLDSQLGTFGLEPPKRYRPDQTTPADNKPKRKRIIDSGRKQAAKSDRVLTPDEKRREQNKKRQQKKRIRKIVYSALLVVAIVAVLIVLSLTVLFKIDTIKINGNDSYTDNEIIAVLPIEKEENLFIADTKSAQEKLTRSLPYIYSVEVKRKFPSTIVVNITEVQRIFAVAGADKTYTLLDKDLKVLETNVIKRPKGSVVVKKLALTSAEVGYTAGIDDEQQQKDILALMDVVYCMQLDEITSIYSVDINSNYMVYDKRITYKLGTTEAIEAKVYSALTATEKLNESDPDAQGEMTIGTDKQIYFTKK